MNTSSHTPGPWVASFWNREPELPAGINYRPAMVQIGERLLRISDDVSGDADARLIAAAPELLALAQYAVDNPDFNSTEFDRMARSVIAKARGDA